MTWHAAGVARRSGGSASLTAAVVRKEQAALADCRRGPGYPEARCSRASATLGRPSAAEIVQVTNFVGPMSGLSGSSAGRAARCA